MNEKTDASAIFAPLWKRKWLILIVGLVVAAGTYLYYKHQPSVYEASTQLYFGTTAEEEGLLSEGANSSSGKNSASANLGNDAALLNSALVREAVRQQLRKTHGPAARAALHGKARAKSSEKSAFVGISAEAHSARGAALLANVTAQEFIKRQHIEHQRAVTAAIGITRKQIQRIEAGERTTSPSSNASSANTSSASGASTSSSSSEPKGKRPAPSRPAPSSSGGGSSGTATVQIASLASRINRLEAELSVSPVQQVGMAKPTAAELVAPMPKKNAIFGFVIGIVLAGIAAYALGRFDRRLRSLADIERTFDTQILSALPAVGHPIVEREGRRAPSTPLVEPLRRLDTTLRLWDVLGRDHKGPDHKGPPCSILFVSADAGDGKSTVITNLALIQGDAGARVAVIEADFRRPRLASLLGVDAQHGLAEVLAGRLTARDAMESVTLKPFDPGTSDSAPGAGGLATAVQTSRAGSVSLLASGGPVSNPPALLAGSAMLEVLRAVAKEYDYVLIDAPPPLQVSDVMPLLHAVDGVALVARIGHTRQTSAERLVQLFKRASSVPVLGAVANNASKSDIQHYGFSPAPNGRRWRSRLTSR